ncbi:MAG TPA: prepilin-type N-terminal cleavage/methylation domain-containing protein [Patescibacteria group bacterium]|nr:prepilin-type N-terminal cleavage/methylation domain-containing protein [Patescibacteria group bacterium]
MRAHGFTLIELLVGMVIFLIGLGLIYAIYFSGQDIWELERTKLDMQAGARTAATQMANELRRTTRTSTQGPSPNAVIPAAPNNTQITFYLPRDADGDTIPDVANDLIIWNINNPIVYRYVPAQKELRRLENGIEKVLARDVTDVRFFDANIDGSLLLNEIKVVLSLGKTTAKNRTVAFSLTSMVRLRN